MKILWYTSVNELDYEMQCMFARMPGYEFFLAIPESANAYFFDVNAKPDFTSIVTEEDMTRVIAEVKPDILVHRYRRDHVPIIEAADRAGVPVLVWVTEQGPDRDIEWNRNIHFRNLAANTVFDQQYLKNRGTENVYYWPFGCLPWFHRPVAPDERFRTDFVGYGNPIYTLYPSKRESIDVLVVPLVRAGYDVSLWGRKDHYGGWLTVPGVVDGRHYKGFFAYDDLAAVNSSAKIVLGITSNGRYGAFGSRFARALASRSFCIWHYSEGMEEMPEGFETGVNCCWSRSPEETLELARFYLDNEAARDKITEKGQQLAYERLNYEKIVPPILEDVIKQARPRSYSIHYDLRKRVHTLNDEGDRLASQALSYQVLAHDVTSLDTRMCVNLAANCLGIGKFKLAQRYLQRFQALTAASRARHARSAETAPAEVDLGRLYSAARSGVQEVARLLQGASSKVETLIERRANGTSRTAAVATLAPPQEIRADAAAMRDVSLWELFLATASRVPLDRTRLLLAGDALPGWADFLAYNCGHTTWLAEGDGVTSPPWTTEDPRPSAVIARDEKALDGRSYDLLLYFALEASPAHDARFQRLLDRVGKGGSVIVTWRPAALDAGTRLAAASVQVLWERTQVGERVFDFEHDDVLAGAIHTASGWFGTDRRERLLQMVRSLSQRIEPRTCHVTLDPFDVLKSGHSWAEGYTAVLQRCCEADGFACRPVGVETEMEFPRQREHAVLEVEIDGRTTTWDAMLGLGYAWSTRELMADPSRGDDPIGAISSPYADKYQLHRMTGADFWRTILCTHPGLYSIHPNGTPAWPVDGVGTTTTADDSWKWATVTQWSATPCGSTSSGAAFGTRQYFDEVELYRYTEYAPWMIEDIGFRNYRGKRLLEIGVGMGSDHLQWARHGAICTGIDLTPRCVEITRHRFNVYGVKPRVMQMDAETLQFPDESFDVVYSFGVLHHTPNTQQAIDEIYRVLKPGGRAIVMLYHRDSLHVFKKVLEGVVHHRFDEGMSLHSLLGEGEITQDGVYPLTKTYTRAEAMFLFRRFRNVENKVRQLVKSELTVPYPRLGERNPDQAVLGAVADMLARVGKAMSQRDVTELGKVFGWNVIIYADK